MDLTKTLLQLTDSEYQMILDGLNELKNKGFAGEMMSGMFEAMLAPKQDASLEVKKAWEESQQKRRLEKQAKEEKETLFKREVDILRSKLFLLQEMKIRQTQKRIQ